MTLLRYIRVHAIQIETACGGCSVTVCGVHEWFHSRRDALRRIALAWRGVR